MDKDANDDDDARDGVNVDDALTRLGDVSADDEPTQATQFGYDFVDLETIEISHSVLRLIPESVVRENFVIPVSLKGDRIRIAMGNGLDLRCVDQLMVLTQREVDPIIASKASIANAINRHYGSNL